MSGVITVLLTATVQDKY